MASSPKLPVFATVQRSYALLFEHFDVFVRVAGIWFFAVIAVLTVTTITLATLVPDSRAAGAVAVLLSLLVGICILGIASAGVAVGWLRFLLLRESPRISLTAHWQNTLVYVLRAAAICVGVVLVFLATLTISARLIGGDNALSFSLTNLTTVAAITGALLVAGRLSLAFPAAAIGEARMTFFASWKFTTRNSWRLLWGGVFALLPLIVLNGLVQGAISRIGAESGLTLIVGVLLSLVWAFASTGVVADFGSLAYRHFVERDGQPITGTSSGPEEHFT